MNNQRPGSKLISAMGAAQKGSLGEIVARDYLEKAGVKIIETNYHSRYGEIDIIGLEDETLVFYEVKAYKRQSVHPAELITLKKIGNIRKTVLVFLDKFENGKYLDAMCRIDLICIKNFDHVFDHIKNIA
ncbi:YraN family protein [bacterium]|jgi:putative endonuclease|nr:YraN family protein [bacterium]